MNFGLVTVLLLHLLCLHESGANTIPGEGSDVAEPINPVAKRSTEHLRVRRDMDTNRALFRIIFNPRPITVHKSYLLVKKSKRPVSKKMAQKARCSGGAPDLAAILYKMKKFLEDEQSTKASKTTALRDDSNEVDPTNIASQQRFLLPFMAGFLGSRILKG